MGISVGDQGDDLDTAEPEFILSEDAEFPSC